MAKEYKITRTYIWEEHHNNSLYDAWHLILLPNTNWQHKKNNKDKDVHFSISEDAIAKVIGRCWYIFLGSNKHPFNLIGKSKDTKTAKKRVIKELKKYGILIK